MEILQINRLYFDEAHLTLIADDYRPVLINPDKLRSHPMQMILLTATCPIAAEAGLCTKFGFQSNNVIIRGPTDRPELEYIKVEKETSWQRHLPHIHQSLQKFRLAHRETGRALIFVPTISLGKEVAKELSCDFYHGQEPKKEVLEDIYKRWYNGNKQVLVATSALSAGVDCAWVYLVIHLGTPRDMINYVQEVSRAGRDKTVSKCILMPLQVHSIGKVNADRDYAGKIAMDKYIWGKEECLRYQITEFDDGRGIRCLEERDVQLCSVCVKERREGRMIVEERGQEDVLVSTWM